MGLTSPPPPRLPVPPVPQAEIERIRGRLHLSTWCRRAAEQEYDAFLRGEGYAFLTPETDADGYVLPGFVLFPAVRPPIAPPTAPASLR